MIQLIRRNPMLAAGILLPLIVVVFFILATAIPRWLVDPPQYDFVFTSMQNSTTGVPLEVRIVVEEKRVRARVYKSKGTYRQVPKLLLFDQATRAVSEVAITLPADLESFEDGAYLNIPDLESRAVSTSRTSPDGYEVHGPSYRGGDFFPFFRSRRSYSFTLHKNGAVVAIPQAGSNTAYYYNANFLGWLVD